MSNLNIINSPEKGMLIEVLENNKKIDVGIVKEIKHPDIAQNRQYKEMVLVGRKFGLGDTIGFAYVDGIWRNLFEDAIYGSAFRPDLIYTFNQIRAASWRSKLFLAFSNFLRGLKPWAKPI